MKAQELRGAAKKYNSLPSHEKVAIDRKMDEINRNIEAHEESKIKDGKNLVSALSKEMTSYAYGFVLNDGWLNVPDTCFIDDGSEIACECCKGVYGSVYRKGRKWYCWGCKEDVAGEVEDEFLNYKRS